MCSDEQLLGMIGCGEKDAFEELYRRYAPMIRNVLRTYLFSAEDLLDLLQEVTLQLWQKAAAFDPSRGNARGWIAMIARSRALDYLRGRRRAPLPEAIEDDLPATAAAPCQASALAIRQAVAQLPGSQRELVTLAYVQGMSHSQIAARLNRPLGTVKTQIRASMSQLRSAMVA